MTDIIVGMFTMISSFVDSVLPTLAGDDNITSALNNMIKLIAASDYFFPVSTFITVLGTIMTYRISMFLWFCVNWVLRFIP